ncbi:MAG: electron transport complex subunit E [Halioglobus sp.]|jgi:electron transport complex protein RnfE|nr:electron transport complex, RnfABCDGE type, E subunit subfamily [marine gamma proteobacterium HTCC2148]MBT3410474.1 electron transport complex subunit E [Halieaceae bacterium]MDG1386857.1 electron transport complex subunit E [Halioglobus sp.]MBT5007825.1 electron transport complex subunit E [Halieaceae bacterium]MBT6124601.1 electron transport complex subunit E [Halieaceae bacterium]
MAEVSYRELSLNGLWKNNPAIVQLLGLCPLLAVTGSVVNAIGLALATCLVLVTSNTAVSLIRNIVSDAVRLPVFVMIIASAVTCIELLMQAFAYELYQILGIFLPLITTNCVILGRAEAFACKNGLLPSIYDGLIMGAGFGVILILLGGLRELAGTGALFADMQLLFGPGAADWKIVIVDNYQAFLLAILPPGAFIFTGLIIAVKNIIDARIQARLDSLKERPVKGSKRVRVTGTIS